MKSQMESQPSFDGPQEGLRYFKLLQQRIEQLTQHLELLQQHNNELDLSIEAIQEMTHCHKGVEVVAPVANGIFIKAALIENQTFLVNVGADTVVEKNADQVLDLLEEQRKELLSSVADATRLLEQLQQQGIGMYQELEKHVRSTEE